MRRFFLQTGLALLVLLTACDSEPSREVALDEAVQGRWREAWPQRVTGFILVFQGDCGPLSGPDPCVLYEPELIENTTTFDLRDGRFTAATRSHVFLDAEDRSDTLQTDLAYREGRYELVGDTLVLISADETERYLAAVESYSLRLRDPNACVPEAGPICALPDLYEVGLPWASATGVLKKSGAFGRD